MSKVFEIVKRGDYDLLCTLKSMYLASEKPIQIAKETLQVGFDFFQPDVTRVEKFGVVPPPFLDHLTCAEIAFNKGCTALYLGRFREFALFDLVVEGESVLLDLRTTTGQIFGSPYVEFTLAFFVHDDRLAFLNDRIMEVSVSPDFEFAETGDAWFG